MLATRNWTPWMPASIILIDRVAASAADTDHFDVSAADGLFGIVKHY